MALVKRIEHGKRITVRDASGKAVAMIKPIKKRSTRNGSRRSQWHLVIEPSVDLSKKPA